MIYCTFMCNIQLYNCACIAFKFFALKDIFSAKHPGPYYSLLPFELSPVPSAMQPGFCLLQ